MPAILAAIMSAVSGPLKAVASFVLKEVIGHAISYVKAYFERVKEDRRIKEEIEAAKEDWKNEDDAEKRKEKFENLIRVSRSRRSRK